MRLGKIAMVIAAVAVVTIPEIKELSSQSTTTR